MYIIPQCKYNAPKMKIMFLVFVSEEIYSTLEMLDMGELMN